MTVARPTVCVVGGGLSGLVVAHALTRRDDPPEVIVLEASERLGGALSTASVDGVSVEAGADSFLTRAPDAVELCGELGLDDALVEPAVFGASILSSGRLLPVPPDFVFGMPSSPGAALRASHLPLRGRVRAAVEPLLPGRPTTRDVSVADLVRRRYGRAVLERSVDPLLAGTRAGRAEEMSLQAALPQVWGILRGRRSVTRALGSARRTNAMPSEPPPFRSVEGGLGGLVDALRAQLDRTDVRLGTSVDAIERAGARFVVTTAGASTECDAVVAATPAFETARFLQTSNPRAASLLGGISFASVATIALVYPWSAGAGPPSGSGMLVPSTEDATVSACTWYSVKWPASAPSDGGLVLRCFVGRAGDDPALELADDELVALVARDVERFVGVSAPPRAARVFRWPRSLPQYRVGHIETVERIEASLEDTPGIWVTGASYRGSGIPDCIRQARATAARVDEWLGS